MTDKDLYTDIFVFYLDPVGKQIGNVCYEHTELKKERKKRPCQKKNKCSYDQKCDQAIGENQTLWPQSYVYIWIMIGINLSKRI